jgi:predicted enzyme related to lactoylglutathione lyase
MKIRDIDFVAYPVSDLRRSIDFYTNVIGLELESTFEDSYAEFDINGKSFAIGMYPSRVPGQTKGAVAFNVEDIYAAREELRLKGVEPVSDVIETPVCRMLFVPDPDGNTFLLHEKPKKE